MKKIWTKEEARRNNETIDTNMDCTEEIRRDETKQRLQGSRNENGLHGSTDMTCRNGKKSHERRLHGRDSP